MEVIERADRECFIRQSPTALKGQTGYLSRAVGQRDGRGWTSSLRAPGFANPHGDLWVGADRIDNMVWTGRVPAGGTPGVPVDALLPVVTSDLFTDARLKPQWERHYQPRADRWSLTERRGFVRLKAFAPLVANLAKGRNTLTQHAGLCHYAATCAGLGVRRSGTTTTIAHNIGGNLTHGPVITQNAM